MVKTASDLLKVYWDGKLPIDPVRIAKAMGVKVVPEFYLGNGESGSVELDDGVPIIRYEITEPLVRQRFTIAHELGHLARGHLNAGKTKFRDTKANFFSAHHDPQEVEANQFAANLLMPSSVVKWVVEQQRVKDVTQLANVFNVSEAAMGYRMKNLGL